MSYTPAPTAGDDIIHGDAQPDIIDALEGNDVIFGGGGDDDLLGGPGNDALYGELGNDSLGGGVGDDRYEVDRTDTITEQIDEGNDSVYFRDESFTGTYYMPANIETLVLVGHFNDMSAFAGVGRPVAIFGNNTGNDSLYGGWGNDYIQGDFAYLQGSNSFSGNTGSDLIRGGDGNDVIWGDQGEGKDMRYSSADDTLFGDYGNDVMYGQAGADTMDGGLGSDTLYGGAGNDVLNGGFDLFPPGKEADLFGSDYFPGNDTLSGGAGNDTYLFGRSSRSDRIVETAVSGETNQLRFEDGVIAADVAVRHEGNDLNFYIVGYVDNKLSVVDYFSATNRPISTAVFSDGTVWTSAEFEAAPPGPPSGDRVIRGTDGNETLTGLAGNDTIDGKDGVDKISGGDGNDYLLGGAGRDMLMGGNGNDVLNGGSEGDRLLGGDGADTLVGDVGDDFLDGGAGNDLLEGGPGQNRLIFQQGDGHDVVRGVATAGGADSTRIELVASYAVGSLGASPVGIASTEVVLTRTGDDLVIDRNDGDDRITVENYFASSAANLYPIHSIGFSDTSWNNTAINAHVASGPSEPPSGPGTTQTGTNGNDTLTGTADSDNLYGRAGDDVLSGGAGNDFLNGELGEDLLIGGAGDDMLIVDNALDAVTEYAGEGTDTVQSYVTYALGTNVENLILIGDLAVNATGNAMDNFITGNTADNVMRGRSGSDVLYGHSGDDFLNGELGQDQMFGGVGNDTVIVDDIGDFVWEAANEGTDTVQSYLDYTLQDNFENLILIGQTGVVANGNALANVIQGNDSDNNIDGMGGLDTLSGNGGNDTLTIHSGQELVAGGSGADTLQLGAGLDFLNLEGLAGATLTGLESLNMGNGNATIVRLTLDQMLALSTESNTLAVDGDRGDHLQIETGWRRDTSGTAGYDQYSSTTGTETGILLVGQAVTVTMGDWVA